MSPAEWSNITRGTYATSCKIKITPLGYRLPFAINDTKAGYANSQTLVQIAHGVGIEMDAPVIKAKYNVADTDLTEVISVERYFDTETSSHLYGSNQISCSFGIPRHINQYAMFCTWNTFNLMKYITISNINDTKGMPVIDYSHEFKNGLLWFPKDPCQAYLNDNALVNTGKDILNDAHTYSRDDKKDWVPYTTTPNTTFQLDYHDGIEKSPIEKCKSEPFITKIASINLLWWYACPI